MHQTSNLTLWYAIECKLTDDAIVPALRPSPMSLDVEGSDCGLPVGRDPVRRAVAQLHHQPRSALGEEVSSSAASVAYITGAIAGYIMCLSNRLRPTNRVRRAVPLCYDIVSSPPHFKASLSSDQEDFRCMRRTTWLSPFEHVLCSMPRN